MSDFNNTSPWGDLKRCIINPDHSKAFNLHPDNSNLREDGTEVNWTDVEGAGQNVMVEIPKFYYMKEYDEANDIFSFGVSDIPMDGFEMHPAFFRDRVSLCDDNSGVASEVDHRYIGAFHGWVDGQNRLRSLPNKTPTTSKTIGDFRTYAKNMGVGWSQFDYWLLYAIQMLYIAEYGHPDNQTMIGRGYVDGNSSSINTGGTLDKGNHTFGETTGKIQMSYRGIEDLWGNVFNFVDGLCSDSSYNLLIGNKGFNNTGAGYDTKVITGSGANINGNIRTIHNDKEAGFIIKTTGGNYDNDGLFDYGGLWAGRLPGFGGFWSDGSGAGLFRLDVSSSASSAFSNRGGRVAL